MGSIIYDPAGLFEQNPNKGGVCEVKDVLFSATGATNNQQIIAAVTGKKIVVLHGTMRSAGIQSAITFKSASGGTNKAAYEVPATTVATPNVKIGGEVWGAFRTNTGEGLFCDNSAAVTVTISLTYIEITP